jgi:hypothetical protein
MSQPRASLVPRGDSQRRSHAGLVLWLAAFAVMLGAATWQRLTGPTHLRRGWTEIAGQRVRWRLPRAATSGQPLRVALPAPEGASGTIHYRRFPLDEPFVEVVMSRQDGALVGFLPTQPPAAKLEYFVTVASPGGTVRIPSGEPLLMRFKGHVPLWILLPHVLVMFFAMLIGVRAALAAAFGRREARGAAWAALLGITLGGMILGPIVQKHAFGAYWTGWPFGGDLTDNKTAAMWIVWIVAVVVLQRRPNPGDRRARVCVVLAALVMLAAYVIPHSLRGSQFAYGSPARGNGARDSTASQR